jgi:gamma-glutamyltranspeptidase/glutathione hydrolase
VLAISVAGGDLQDQTTLNLLLDHVEFGMLPQEAVRVPRFATMHHEDSFSPIPDRPAAVVDAGSLTVNESLDEDVRADLAARGHTIHTTDRAVANPIMLYIDRESGQFHIAGDPDARRHAAAID